MEGSHTSNTVDDIRRVVQNFQGQDDKRRYRMIPKCAKKKKVWIEAGAQQWAKMPCIPSENPHWKKSKTFFFFGQEGSASKLKKQLIKLKKLITSKLEAEPISIQNGAPRSNTSKW